MHKGIKVFSILILSLSLLFLAPWGLQAKTLIIASTQDPGTLDPAVAMGNFEWKQTYPSYDRLVKYKGASTEVEPMLARSWEVSKDGLSWKFFLRKDVKFQDGRPLKADAVVFTFERLRKIGKGPWDAFPTLESVKALDDYTVLFTLSKPFAPFLSTLAINGASIINPNVVKFEKGGDLAQAYLAEHTMGSGPYYLAEWQRGQRLLLKANKAYWGGAPKINEVIIRIIKEPADQRLLLEKGEIDIAEGIEIDQILKLKGVKGIRVAESPSLFVDYVYINAQRAPLDNFKVRQALSYAIDYQGIIQHVQRGLATQMRGPIPKGLWGYSEKVFQYKRDVAQAKRLLAEAGFPQGFATTLSYSPRRPWWEQEALVIQANLAEIGVKVELRSYADPTFREKIDRGDFDLAFGVWSPDYGDPYMFMNYWFDSANFGLPGNRARYKNERVDTLIRRAAVASDPKERFRLYLEAQNLVVTEAPYILLYQKNLLLPMRANIKGYIFNPMLEEMYPFQAMDKP